MVSCCTAGQLTTLLDNNYLVNLNSTDRGGKAADCPGFNDLEFPESSAFRIF